MRWTNHLINENGPGVVIRIIMNKTRKNESVSRQSMPNTKKSGSITFPNSNNNEKWIIIRKQSAIPCRVE